MKYIFLFLLLFPFNIYATDVYKCPMPDGSFNFTDEDKYINSECTKISGQDLEIMVSPMLDKTDRVKLNEINQKQKNKKQNRAINKTEYVMSKKDRKLKEQYCNQSKIRLNKHRDLMRAGYPARQANYMNDTERHWIAQVSLHCN